ncbi:FHA domain-containing protein [Deltaproteobacteria bacterium TL4]
MYLKLSRLFFTLVIGTVGGMSSWALLQIFYFFHMRQPLPLLDQFIYEGVMAGIGFGAYINANEALLNSNREAIVKRMLWGTCLGGLSGLISFTCAQSLLAFYTPILWIRLTAWTLLGLCIGGVTSYQLPLSKRFFFQILGGGIGGISGGILFEFCQKIPYEYLGNFFGLIVFGVCLSLAMTCIETLFSKAYLRVLCGNNEGQVYLLDKDQFLIGYSSQSDIMLSGYAEVCDKHARIYQQKSQCIMRTAQVGGQILINFRSVNQQVMKKGDIIKIGTALLQYCEI